MSELRQAAQAVVDRWDTPLWKDAPHTAEFIDRLRAALARSGQAASGSSQGARSDGDRVLWFMANGWNVTHVPPCDALTDEANRERAWYCERNEAPFCTNSTGVRVWYGPTAITALENSLADLGREFPKVAKLANPGQPEAPTAAPLNEERIIEIARPFGEAPRWPSSFIDFARAIEAAVLAHPPARSGADPTGRTPTDYALEHAEYLAQSAELFIASTMALQKAEIALEEAAEPTDDMGTAIEVARESLSDHLRGLESNVYEFRKRRDRAIARSGAGSEEGQG